MELQLHVDLRIQPALPWLPWLPQRHSFVVWTSRSPLAAGPAERLTGSLVEDDDAHMKVALGYGDMGVSAHLQASKTGNTRFFTSNTHSSVSVQKLCVESNIASDHYVSLYPVSDVGYTAQSMMPWQAGCFRPCDLCPKYLSVHSVEHSGRKAGGQRYAERVGFTTDSRKRFFTTSDFEHTDFAFV
ncbi:Kelch-like protein 13 [Liparis tanakae]|uniref:Kelch-like protein 13 n=1 Tax=Liparis tanakae TaxID=230148 RepID=A0A4Z2FLC3_9TELE|nr:Kelch-like protein 13 [Liparis tanakae]